MPQQPVKQESLRTSMLTALQTSRKVLPNGRTTVISSLLQSAADSPVQMLLA